MRVVVIVVLVMVLAVGIWRLGQRWGGEAPAMAPSSATPSARASAFRTVVFPTDQQGLLEEPRVGVFQPTASGNVQSALYGSVRTMPSGQGLIAQFHEGIDIAPLQRDKRGMPLDKVYAVADGKVGYVNRRPGNSNYGNYVVLLHNDPMGEVYTLYAHLAAVDHGIQSGLIITAGTALGRMGNTPASNIPAARSHVHFEVGLVSNAKFGEWFRSQRLKPDHGVFNGLNLLALNPIEFFRTQRGRDDFSFELFLNEVPVAFEILVPIRHPLDYFRRYPALWEGAEVTAGWVVLSCSENGTLLRGRAATRPEIRLVPSGAPKVLNANAEVLGRNGCHLVQRKGSGWSVGAKGRRWLEIVTYP